MNKAPLEHVGCNIQTDGMGEGGGGGKARFGKFVEHCFGLEWVEPLVLVVCVQVWWQCKVA